ncbi:MAG: DUF364 domain-containing protein [Elusimicrobiota bacterium]
MKKRRVVGTLQMARAVFRRLVRERGLSRKRVEVAVKPLTPEEAIGRTRRKDYPIIKGKERVIEALVLGSKGQAFTDAPGGFSGTLGGVLRLPLDTSRRRAVFVAVLNAACRALGLASGTVHCKDGDPERCGSRIAGVILARRGACRVGLVGFNPALAAHLVRALGRRRVRILDLNASNIGEVKSGVRVEDGARAAEEVVRWADVVLVTGTTLVNGTFDVLLRLVHEHGKDYLPYGITIAGVSVLLGLPRECPCGRND